MKNVFFSITALILIFGACNTKSSSDAATHPDVEQEATETPKQTDNKLIKFRIADMQFERDAAHPDVLEVEMIQGGGDNWLLQLHGTNSESKTDIGLSFTLESFNFQPGDFMVKSASIAVYSETEPSPINSEIMFGVKPMQIRISAVNKAEESGNTIVYYTLDGTFEGTFRDVLDQNRLQVQSGTFKNLRLMKLN